jgi:prephenate dehydrogenase
MRSDFSKIAILGSGLLGGSLALALAALGDDAPQVSLWARSEHTVTTARNFGIHNITADLSEAVRDAKMVILAVPIGSMAALVAAALEAGLPDGCLITDVGSVKCVPHHTIPPLLKGRDIHFIGSHPMAGSERNGLSAITNSLFQNAACLLTNDNSAPPEIAAALERFWKTIGCRTSWMAAAVHDELVARISHLPHLMSASTARVCLKDPAEGRFGGGGLRDTTRVAAGNPPMWAEIVTENREALTDLLKETIIDLRAILAALESGDQEQALQWLLVAKNRRDSLTHPL